MERISRKAICTILFYYWSTTSSFQNKRLLATLQSRLIACLTFEVGGGAVGDPRPSPRPTRGYRGLHLSRLDHSLVQGHTLTHAIVF